jgi:hypothetical protein
LRAHAPRWLALPITAKTGYAEDEVLMNDALLVNALTL